MNWFIDPDAVGYFFSLWYVSFLWHSFLVFAGISIILYAFRKNSSRVKCFIWMAAIAMMLVVPALSKMTSGYKIPIYSVDVRGAEIHDTSQVGETFAEIADGTGTSQRFVDYLSPYAFFIALYAISVISMLFLFLAGRRKMNRIVLRSTPVLDTAFLALFDSCRRTMRVTRDIQVLESDETFVPFTIYVLRPVIVLPAGLYTRITNEEIRHVLLHELAHVKRFDSPLLVIAALVRVLFFLNPFIWFAVSRVSSLAEEACDEHVVGIFGEPVSYARTLTAIAESIRLESAGIEYVAGFVFSRHVFLRRINTILSMRNNTVVRLSWSKAAGLVLMMGILIISVVSFPVTIGAVGAGMMKSPVRKLEEMKEKASTRGKREAIETIQMAFKTYDRHYDAAKCAEMILDADRNVAIIGRIAETAVSVPYHTKAFIKIAGYASKAKIADDEFLTLADMAKKYGSETMSIVKLARKASEARSEEKLAEIRVKINALDKRLAAQGRTITSRDRNEPPIMTMQELEKKLLQADTREKREAIGHIRDLLLKYKRHQSAAQCVNLILESDRNADIIGKIAEYAIKTRYHTLGFIRIAEYAAEAPVADDEFITLAKKMKKPWAGGNIVDVAKKASEAASEAELKTVMEKL